MDSKPKDMPDYRRAYLNGGTFFFTVVTYKRRSIFQEEPAIDLLRECLHTEMASNPFLVEAMVILPDHLHTIWTLPHDDSDYSTRWQRIKATFSRHYERLGVVDVSESISKKNEKGVWQRRFWEHAVRDQADFNRHCDYIHYNPVKHGLVDSPLEWKHSSFRSFFDKGLYAPDWGRSPVTKLQEMDLE